MYRILLIFMLFHFSFITPLCWAASPEPPLIMAVIGDSLVDGYGLPKSKLFPALIEEKLKQHFNQASEVINSGIDGSTTASALSRLKWIEKRHPQVIMIVLGGNDGLRGLPLKDSQKNLAETIEYAQSKNIKVILAGMKLPTNYGAEYRNQFEKLYQELAEKYQLIFIPFVLKDVATVKELNLPDGIHPNEKGHQKVADLVYPYVLKAFDLKTPVKEQTP